MNRKTNMIETIGETPLISLKSPNPIVKIYAKLEMFNPTGSIKDRIVDYIFKKALKHNLIKKNTIVIEGSSGNTGASVAMLCAIHGISCKIFVPDKTSSEKISIIKSYGAEVVVKSSFAIGEEEYAASARKESMRIPNSYFIDQYNNPWNLEAHYHTTGKEIWEQTNGNVNYIVATGSTGGTLCGISKFLKEQKKSVKSILADPVGSIYQAYYKGDENYLNTAHPYLVEGAGKMLIPDVIDFSLIDRIISFNDIQAFQTALDLCKNEGIIAGGSSGGNVYASYQLALLLKKPATIVTILPDSGLKYISKMYNQEWFNKHFT